MTTNAEHVRVLGELLALGVASSPVQPALTAAIAALDRAAVEASKAEAVEGGPQPSAAVTEAMIAAVELVELVEGPGCLRWQASDGFRFKDTKQWAIFYAAAKKAALAQGGKP